MAESQLHVATADASPERKLFLDENGNPSDRCGPDLTKAEPIDHIITRLARLRNSYAAEIWKACRDSGVDISVTRTAEGVDQLQLGLPCDSQEDIRRPRYEALAAQIQRSETRRRGLIDLVNMLGHFADNQPFPSIAKAALALAASGGRIWVEPNGTCDETIPIQEHTFSLELHEGFPLRRLFQRYHATLRRHGGRAAMSSFVREHGVLREGSGCIVFGPREIANA